MIRGSNQTVSGFLWIMWIFALLLRVSTATAVLASIPSSSHDEAVWFTRFSWVPFANAQEKAHWAKPVTLGALANYRFVSVQRAGESVKISLPVDELFNTRSANFTSKAYPLLKAVSDYLRQEAIVASLGVIGYTDNDIRSSYRSQLLSRDQAIQVMSFLKNMDLPAVRFWFADGRGQSDCIGDNRYALGRAYNRRVEIHYRILPGTNRLDDIRIKPIRMIEKQGDS